MVKNTPARLINCLQHWASESLYFNANDYFEQLMVELDLAKETIELECYIFSQDQLGRRIISSLIIAVKRGVKVRLIIDGAGCLDWEVEHIVELKTAGIEVKIYHPLPWQLSFYKEINIARGFLLKLVYLISRVNKRDHRKLYIIDKKTAWSGSINISASHLSKGHNIISWFDCGVRLTGSKVLELYKSFEDIWRVQGRYTIGKKRLPFRTNNNVVRRQRKNFELIQLIRSSKKRIWIISAYLLPSRRLINAIKHAQSKDVDVKILISHRSDVIFFPLVSTTYYKELINADIKIYEYDKKIMHAKTILLDDLLFIGSSNLNHRSFLHDLELDIIVTKKSSIQTLKQKFEQLIAQSELITITHLSEQTWLQRLLGKVFWRLRYWL